MFPKYLLSLITLIEVAAVGFIALISAPALISHLTPRTVVLSSEKKM